MKDYRIICGIIVLLLHSEELEQPKAIKREEGGLFSRAVVFNLRRETGLKELSHRAVAIGPALMWVSWPPFLSLPIFPKDTSTPGSRCIFRIWNRNQSISLTYFPAHRVDYQRKSTCKETLETKRATLVLPLYYLAGLTVGVIFKCGAWFNRQPATVDLIKWCSEHTTFSVGEP